MKKKKYLKIWNFFRLTKELNYTAIKDIRNLFRLAKETKAIEDRILWDIKHLFEYEEENDKEHLMHSKNDSTEIMISDETDEVIKEFFDSIKNR